MTSRYFFETTKGPETHTLVGDFTSQFTSRCFINSNRSYRRKTLHMMKVLYFTSLVCMVSGYMLYQDKIPNGGKVPHPCKPNYVWQGVGHMAKTGGGARNAFGQDFERNGKKWDVCLCKRDSDGDGKTNGEELGDPECKWTSLADNAALRSTELSHPGVCEPLEDATCKVNNDFDICGRPEEESVCDAVGDPDVIELNVTLTSTNVPAQETTYICQIFDMPTDADYHMVGSQGLIDNKYVMHHILMFACDLDADETEMEAYRQPRECSMGDSSCRNTFAGWSLGQVPLCWNSQNYGFPIGKNSFKKVMMQMHWNNPEMKTGYTDSSGMKLFLNRKLKTYNMGTLTVGPRNLELPPGQPAVVQKGGCSRQCTQSLPNDIFIVRGALHMHYLGASGKTELYREGEKVQDILDIPVYNYDNPIMYDLKELRLKPGDEIKVTCVYKTTSQTETVTFGDATSAEMCFSFLNYYPAFYNFTRCLSFDDLDICVKPGKALMEYEDCNIQHYFQVEVRTANTTKAVVAQCDLTGKTCRPGCKEALTAFKAHPCQQGSYGKLVEEFSKSGSRKMLVSALHSCDEKSGEADDNKTEKDNDEESIATAPQGACVFNDQEEKTSGTASITMTAVTIITLVVCTTMLATIKEY